MSNTPPIDPYKVTPLRGGQINNDTSFTGGIPVLDSNKIFTSTTTTSTGPPSFMAIRTQNISNMMKIESGAKQAPSTIFSSATDAAYGLMTYVGLVHRHLIEYGMDTIFYFTTQDGNLVNIIDGHSQFTKDEVSKQVMELYDNRDNTFKNLPLERYDMYDLQNLHFSAAFILASISPVLQAQVLTKAGPNYNKGPIVWMYVMNLVQSSSYRGTKLLQKTFEDRKLKSEPGENVIKHTIKLRNDYMRLFNANMVPYDALMTVVDSLVCSSTPAFDVWAATKRIAISQFLKENAGKTQRTLSLIPDAPTISSICDQADEEYQSLLESGLWVATDLKKDKDAAPTAFLLEKLTARVNNIEKREGTCWTCGKEGHKSPDCPTKTKPLRPSNTSLKKVENRKKPPKGKSTRPEWQQTKPMNGESETMIRNNKSWSWCNTCAHWSTTHNTSTHLGSDPINKRITAKSQTKNEESQGNLAQIVTTNNSNELTLGAWCGFTTDSTNTPETPDTDLGTWITAVSRSSKKRNTSATCINCNSIFYRPKRATNPTCCLCNSALYSALMAALTGDPDAYVGGYYYTNPKTGRVIYAPTTSLME
jgi:Zinc knuckle